MSSHTKGLAVLATAGRGNDGGSQFVYDIVLGLFLSAVTYAFIKQPAGNRAR